VIDEIDDSLAAVGLLYTGKLVTRGPSP